MSEKVTAMIEEIKALTVLELSELVRVGEMSRERALEIIHSPIEESDLEKPLEKMGLTVEDVYCYDKQ